jgi:hypothetical protein
MLVNVTIRHERVKILWICVDVNDDEYKQDVLISGQRSCTSSLFLGVDVT